MIISPLYISPYQTTIFRRVPYLIQDIYWLDRLLVEDLREGDLAGLRASKFRPGLLDWDWDHPSNR